MKTDQRLWRTLHVLIHMSHHPAPLTSQTLAKMLNTNAVVVRRTLACLREKQLIQAEKGHGGGWILIKPLHQISLREIYDALGEPTILHFTPESNLPGCLVEKAVNQALDKVLQEAHNLVLERFESLTLAHIEQDFQTLLQSTAAGVIAG
ncbi:transcriptional regulator [bacterium (Candidatus Blackallbacteria) CG17_big_fil_post_rev_8_21_14_2_50_48_46]|uniref:Transcriptional regulator n=1 Tax=bacterium (Candidatus Blackallbacteria) CG17_big_fil_post_rev_8_21_14_2_50_48_46 TaxID=2014261 RepID=A0A2M7G821_9BACT|nr:MAG: transcriptional regulator [bacterium (Candidatus Blackallbacteria) CG18_big_fil_WC_8_21_14_2_50_49_26]PIW17925.1 MAG: transcriptional regulator [bacterium (Candidatus Blackallbacteria) CG17_big_fil_post_rev_8_21_14_2_50_48_46]PIW45744.1 MAG: transcriptional regulator [bacterium (Candidatus Blackallbacteria) CG13_big_fil_rev_8_21_14_2_50_49_14]